MSITTLIVAWGAGLLSVIAVDDPHPANVWSCVAMYLSLAGHCWLDKRNEKREME